MNDEIKTILLAMLDVMGETLEKTENLNGESYCSIGREEEKIKEIREMINDD